MLAQRKALDCEIGAREERRSDKHYERVHQSHLESPLHRKAVILPEYDVETALL